MWTSERFLEGKLRGLKFEFGGGGQAVDVAVKPFEETFRRAG